MTLPRSKQTGEEVVEAVESLLQGAEVWDFLGAAHQLFPSPSSWLMANPPYPLVVGVFNPFSCRF